MRYIATGGEVVPKHCKYGPRPAEGIVFSPAEWWSITDHLFREQREKELLNIMKAKEEGRKANSFDMMRDWAFTLARIKTQGDQDRIDKKEKEKQYKIDEYNQIVKKLKEERKNFVEGARKKLYEDRDEIKTINSAMLLSTVLEERKKQIELKKRLKEERANNDTELAIQMKKEAEDFAREKLQEKMEELAKKKFHKQELDKQMAEILQRKDLKKEEFEAEKQDLIKMKIEEELIRKCEMKEKKIRKESAIKYIQKTESQLEYERNLKLEQDEEDEIHKIYICYDRRFKKERKEREDRILNDQIEQRLKIAEKLAADLKLAAKAEEHWLENAAWEKEEEAKRELERKERMRKKAVDDLLQSKKEAEERRARELREKKEQKKWELMQMYRTTEKYDEWKQSERRKKLEKEAETRAAYDEQCKEAEARRARDLKEWLTPLEDFTVEKESLLRYCQDALDFARDNDLPSYPVKVAVAKAKKLNGLWQEPQAEQGNQQEQAEGPCGRKKSKQAPMGSGCYCLKY